MKIAIPVALVLLSCAGFVSGQPADSPWPMFQRDARHTGRTNEIGPEQPNILWTYNTGTGMECGSVAMDEKARLYFGSLDNSLYCIDSSGGALVWSYEANEYVLSTAAIGNGGNV